MPDEDDDRTQDDPANLRGLLKERTKERDQLRREAEEGAEAKKRLAIYEAGITDPKLVKLLGKVHEGEWTDEAIKATVAEYGFGSQSQGETSQQPDDGKTEREQAMKDLAAVASSGRGTDTRKPAANDDEALQEELLDLMTKFDPKKQQKEYLAAMDGLMIKYGVKGSKFPT